MMNEEIKKEVEQRWNSSDDDLYYDIGLSLYGRPAFPPPAAKLIEKGRAWLLSNQAKFAQALCPDPKVQALYSEELSTKNLIDLVVIVADSIMSLKIGVPVPPANASLLLVRMGLRQLCGENWPVKK